MISWRVSSASALANSTGSVFMPSFYRCLSICQVTWQRNRVRLTFFYLACIMYHASCTGHERRFMSQRLKIDENEITGSLRKDTCAAHETELRLVADEASTLARLAKALAHPVRVQIVDI